jgi:hypothetical protein
MTEQEMRVVPLPSGATLKINDAPFRDAHSLYQSVLKMLVFAEVPEGKTKKDVIMDYLPLTLSSPEVHQSVMKCFQRAIYSHPEIANGSDQKITEATFEPLVARGDFVLVCIEVMTQNLDPFLSGLLLKSSQKAEGKRDSSQK